MARRAIVSLIAATALLHPGATSAQVPVIDNATLTQATQTASNTAQIMQTNQQIMNYTQQTLAAVTGNRTTGSFSSIGLSGGFSMSSLPGLSQLLGGGGISMAGTRIIRLHRLVDHQRAQSRQDANGRGFGVYADRSRLHRRGEYRRRGDGGRRRRAKRRFLAFVGVHKRREPNRHGGGREGFDRPELAVGHAKRPNDQRIDRNREPHERRAQRAAATRPSSAIEALDDVDLQSVASDADGQLIEGGRNAACFEEGGDRRPRGRIRGFVGVRA